MVNNVNIALATQVLAVIALVVTAVIVVLLRPKSHRKSQK
jgi:hypothetical protein